jgi:hypothetical protein
MTVEMKMIDTDAKAPGLEPKEGELNIYVATDESLAGDLDEFQERVAAAAKVTPSSLMRPIVIDPVNEGDAKPIVVFVSKS